MGAQQLYFGTLAPALSGADASRPLWPTSPSNGWLDEGMGIPDMCIYDSSGNGGPSSAGFAAPICDSSNPARGDGHFYTTTRRSPSTRRRCYLRSSSGRRTARRAGRASARSAP